MDTGRSAQMIQRLQDLETVVVKQLDRALSKVQNGIALCWTTVTTTIGQVVDTRVLGKVDKWNSSGKAWPKWSFVMKVYDVAVDQQPSGAEISADVVSNVQLGGVQLHVVLIMLCTGKALDCAVSAMYSWGMEAWRMFCHAYSLWNDARLVVLMLEVLAILLDTKDVGVQSGCWMHRNDKHRFECIGRGCLHVRIQRCFQGFWRETGFRVRVLVLREATVSIRMSQDEVHLGRAVTFSPTLRLLNLLAGREMWDVLSTQLRFLASGAMR